MDVVRKWHIYIFTIIQFVFCMILESDTPIVMTNNEFISYVIFTFVIFGVSLAVFKAGSTTTIAKLAIELVFLFIMLWAWIYLGVMQGIMINTLKSVVLDTLGLTYVLVLIQAKLIQIYFYFREVGNN